MPEMTGAEYIIRHLESEGVKFSFTHPGGPLLPIYNALKESKIRNVLVRHEEAASFMTDAIGKLTGRPAICMSTMGPGAANMIIGIATSHSDSTPAIAITGQLYTTSLGKGYQQETDHVKLYEGITKWSVRITRTDKLPEVLRRAFRVATSGRPGPVHLDIPRDVQLGTSNLMLEPETYRSDSRVRCDPSYIKKALQEIEKSERPVILAGGGVMGSGATAELKALAEKLSIPVATSYNGRGSLPEDHPLCLGRAGEFAPRFPRELAGQADLLLAIGYRFTDVSMDGWKPAEDCRIIQIDIDPTEIGQNYSVHLGLVGDAKSVLQDLLSISSTGKRDWARKASEAKERFRREYSKTNSDEIPIKPQRVMKELDDLVDENAIVTAGAGRAKMWAASLLEIRRERKWIHSGGYAPMGYELCAAIGLKLAQPDRQVVAICGDASFQMVCQELATAVENNAPFLACILNDRSLGIIRYAQLKNFGRTFSTEFELDVDLSKVAQAFGARGKRIEKPSEIREAVKEGLKSDRPYVLDILVDINEEAIYPL